MLRMGGQGFGSLDDVPGLVEQALDGRAASTCLLVGTNTRLIDCLSAQLQNAGQRLAVFAVGASGSERASMDGAYLFEGPPLGHAQAPALAEVIAFSLKQADPVETVRGFSDALGGLREDQHGPALDAIAEDFHLSRFDIAVIAGETAFAGPLVARIHGSKAILLDGTRQSFGGAQAYAALFDDTRYKLVAGDDHEFGGWALFVLRDSRHANLPVHFFTIVLNGEPFIRYHEQMLRDLECPWHWHIVEGVASLVKDTAWSVASGGHIADSLHNRGKSNDGTTEYLDELKTRYPNRISIYRKPPDVFWDGKIEMVSAPIPSITEPCLLWQIDADELWRADQIETVRRMFIEQPERGAAYFWCNYFVGSSKAVSTRYNYAQNPNQEWLRAWRFEPGMIWDKHEPPVLVGTGPDGRHYDVGKSNPFTHRETEAVGAVFDHFAYTTPQQAQFKETYYGYADAVKQWRALQAHDAGSGHLRDYFAWVTDETMFDTVDRLGIVPLAVCDQADGSWQFRDLAEFRKADSRRTAGKPRRIVVDGVFFQLAGGGISRLWVNLLQEWVRSGFGDHVTVLDRGGTIDRIDGVIYHSIDRHDWATIDGDARYLQAVCDRLGADLFLSTYYTTPIRTPSVFMGYDMIPEAMGFDLEDVWWRQKRRAIQYAVGHTMISHSSARELSRIHPDLPVDDTLVAYCSVDPHFRACTAQEIAAFRENHAIDREFVMLVGERFGWKGYKNGAVVFAALSQIPPERRPLLVCVGGQPHLEDAARAFLDESDVRLLRLDDEDLRACYASALAYICPSSMEGFGLPIAEAMTVGCPALVCANSSIPEVAGDAGVYFDHNDPGSLVDAIEAVRDPARRSGLIAAGKQQVRKFDQVRSAREIAEFCLATIDRVESGELRVQSQALADSYREAERSRDAVERTEGLEREVHALKTALSSQTRIPAVAHDHVAAADARILVAAERELASIHASNGTSVTAVPTVLPASSGEAIETLRELVMPLRMIESAGLHAPEGPYPQFEIPRQFRWQVEPASRFVFRSDFGGDALLELAFGNLEPAQTVRVLVEGTCIGSVTPPASGWQYQWHAALPLHIAPGKTEVVVEATRCSERHDDGHARYVAIYGVSIKPR